MVSISRKGEDIVQKYFEEQGFIVSRVANRREKHWDLEVTSSTGREMKIEVKTTRKKRFALVDLSDTQVISSEDKTRIISLLADELWIVTDVNAKKPKAPQLYRITRKRFQEMVTQNPEKITPKVIWKINDRTAENFAEPIESDVKLNHE